jgi:hypothetical protein
LAISPGFAISPRPPAAETSPFSAGHPEPGCSATTLCLATVIDEVVDSEGVERQGIDDQQGPPSVQRPVLRYYPVGRPAGQVRHGRDNGAGGMTDTFARFYRPRHRWRDRFRAYKLEIDGEIVGAVRYGAEVVVPVRAGEHIVRALIDWTGSEPLTTWFEPGGTVTIRVEPSSAPDLQSVRTTDEYLQLTVEQA